MSNHMSLALIAALLAGRDILRRPRRPSALPFRSPIPTRRSSGNRSWSPMGSRSTCSPPTRLIAKPLQMNFDPAGRLWIASSEVYPQIKPGAGRQRQGPDPRRPRRRRPGRQDDASSPTAS